MWATTYYNLISRLYDPFTRSAYARARQEAVQELRLPPGSTVLDLACGTGQNFPLLIEALGPEGRIIGLDYSQGMLRRATDKVRRNGWTNIILIQEDARKVGPDLLRERAGVGRLDGLICTLGLSVVPEWRMVFDNAFSLVRSGGRCVIMDGRTLEGPKRLLNPLLVPLVGLTAAADIRRPLHGLLDGPVDDLKVSRFLLGFVFVASGTKP